MKKTLSEKIKELPPRLLLALGCYLVLVLVGLYILLPVRTREESFLLGMFLVVFALLAVKSIVHTNREK